MKGNIQSHYFTEDALRDWEIIGSRHRIRDERFLRTIEIYFCCGPILEIGAATGHLSAILNQRGYDVTASDISPIFVSAIMSRGVTAELIDVTRDIRAQSSKTFANVLAQNVMPLILRDRETLCTTLAMIHAALQPHGRLICISADARRDCHPESYFRPREQIEIARLSGLFRLIKAFPHQVVPTSLYREWNARLLNFADFKLAKIASIRWVWVMEKLG
ncbi:MAG TPA: methyltransferase domain-containing protein [Rhizomicrobium sp.]